MAKYAILVTAELIPHLFMNGKMPRVEITNVLPEGVSLHNVDYDFISGIVTFVFIDKTDESYKLIEPIFHEFDDD